MPIIKIQGKNIYYEIYGEGEPVIFLNGIMMSTSSWKPFISAFSDYKMVLIDLIDQGRSDKGDVWSDIDCDVKGYDQFLHVEMLRELIEKLKLGKVHIMGISYGGEVAMKFAIKYGDCLKSLILSNTTAITTNIMKDIEETWDFVAATYDGKVFFKATMPYIYSTKFYEENIEWLKAREQVLASSLTKEWYDGFRRAIRSASSHNVLKDLESIKVPTLILGAELDIITPLRYQEEIHKRVANSRMVIIKDAGHALMYEKPYEFTLCILGFIKILGKNINIG